MCIRDRITRVLVIILETLEISPEPIAGINFPATKANIGQQPTYTIMHINPFKNLLIYGVIGGINCKIFC